MSFLQRLFGPPDVDELRAKRDVKGLIKALGYEKDVRVRQAAACALGKVRDERAVKPLIATLEDKHMCEAAVGALTKVGKPAIAPLIVALGDSSETMREAAAEALAEIGAPAVERLIVFLKYSSGVTQEAAAKALRKIGAPAVELLIAALEDKSIREVAIRTLGKIDDEWAIEQLISALKDHSQFAYLRDHHKQLCQAVVRVLVMIGPPAAGPLIAALKDRDGEVRLSAIEALGEIGDARAVEPLIAMLADKYVRTRSLGEEEYVDASVGMSAALALGRIGDKRAVEPLLASLKTRTGPVGGIIEALGQIGDPRAIEPLLAAIKDGVMDHLAFKALGQIGDTRAVEPLIVALEDDKQSKTMRGHAAGALGAISDARAVEPLIAALKDEDQYMRLRAIEALGQIGDARAVEPLIAALKDDKQSMQRTAAARALKSITGQDFDEDAAKQQWWEGKQ